MAVALQSRVSEVLAVDIHPAARLGRGILLDHGTGVVIGETAVIGNNVSLLQVRHACSRVVLRSRSPAGAAAAAVHQCRLALALHAVALRLSSRPFSPATPAPRRRQNVTLGGTGKEVGDRHPKISDNVLIGASATVLGNIVVGRGAQVGPAVCTPGCVRAGGCALGCSLHRSLAAARLNKAPCTTRTDRGWLAGAQAGAAPHHGGGFAGQACRQALWWVQGEVGLEQVLGVSAPHTHGSLILCS